MKHLSKIYLEAMKKVANGSQLYCCFAIAKASGRTIGAAYKNNGIVALDLFLDIFDPEGDGEGQRLVTRITKSGSSAQWKNHRLIMLSLMAAAWRDLR